MRWPAPESLPYCGAAPSPALLWTRWNLDPALLAVLAMLALAYALGARRTGLAAWRVRCAAAGWAILSLALISPLCALSVSLFSARVGQHMLLTLVAVPMIALGRPEAALARRTGAPGAGMPLAAAATFACALWLWHAPVPYDLTFVSTPLYWTMHLTMIGAALWLWRELLRDGGRPVAIAAAALIGMVAMSLVGALITFAPRPLYAPHLVTPYAWGLSPLEDQQLGGAIMWVPGGVVFLGAAVAAVSRALAARLPSLSGSRS